VLYLELSGRTRTKLQTHPCHQGAGGEVGSATGSLDRELFIPWTAKATATINPNVSNQRTCGFAFELVFSLIAFLTVGRKRTAASRLTLFRKRTTRQPWELRTKDGLFSGHILQGLRRASRFRVFELIL